MNELDIFRAAESYVMQHYFDEIERAKEFLEIELDNVDKRFFLMQYTHVVYCSGFKWAVVDKRWDEIYLAYCSFNIDSIVEYPELVKKEALKIIAHKRKIDAIINTSKWLNKISDRYFRQYLNDARKNLDFFKKLDYIGDITKYHLALCLGFDVSKPDVHITRLANLFNKEPINLCKGLSDRTGYPIRIVDAILWRASEQGILSKFYDITEEMSKDE